MAEKIVGSVPIHHFTPDPPEEDGTQNLKIFFLESSFTATVDGKEYIGGANGGQMVLYVGEDAYWVKVWDFVQAVFASIETPVEEVSRGGD